VEIICAVVALDGDFSAHRANHLDRSAIHGALETSNQDIAVSVEKNGTAHAAMD
jgi:hypothetical protein